MYILFSKNKMYKLKNQNYSNYFPKLKYFLEKSSKKKINSNNNKIKLKKAHIHYTAVDEKSFFLSIRTSKIFKFINIPSTKAVIVQFSENTPQFDLVSYDQKRVFSHFFQLGFAQ